MTYHVSHFINGKLITDSNETLDIYNPATGKRDRSCSDSKS